MKTNKRLLIIEDDLDLVALLENFYRTRNFEVQAFSDPQKVVALFEENVSRQEDHFDVMLVDLNLPHINGIEFIRKLKEMHSHVPMILMTAVMDFVAPLVPIGLGTGRLGNFIGGELWHGRKRE